MALTEEQKARLKAKTASAELQSKLPETPDNVAKFNPDAAAYMDREDAKLQAAIEARKAEVPADSLGHSVIPQPVESTMSARESYDLYVKEQQYKKEQQDKINGVPLQEYKNVEEKYPVTPVATYNAPASRQQMEDDPLDALPDELPGREVVVHTSMSESSLQIAEGFSIRPGATEEEIDDLAERVFSYVGVTPRHISEYAGQWFKVLGALAQPLEGDVTDKVTGAIEHLRWMRTLLKIEEIDKRTGQNVILYGGGVKLLDFVRFMCSYKGVGDWKRPMSVYVKQEQRANGHIMYSVMPKKG